MSASIEITYAAHTSTCTFLLDAEGICRRIVLAPSNKRDAGRNASRCIGAQYVASLDASVTGMLAEMPRVGSSMLFARVDERGRVSLVRTGAVTRFERHRIEDPFVEPEEAPSMSVETSAPMITPSAPTPRASHTAVIPQDPYEDEESIERTQPIHALPLQMLRSRAAMDQPIGDDDATLDQSSDRGSGPRQTWPSEGNESPSGPATVRQPSTLRQLPVALAHHSQYSEGSEAPYAARGRLPRRSEPQVGPGDLGRPPRPSLPPPPPVNRVAARGRGDR
ncbi:MAG: hypothetical protein K0S65_6046 [Labilithrix sp.]|nr:hypothetical protein [Labilithrix sp.]